MRSSLRLVAGMLTVLLVTQCVEADIAIPDRPSVPRERNTAVLTQLRIHETDGQSKLLIPQHMLSKLAANDPQRGFSQPRTLFAGICLSLAGVSLVITRGRKWPVKGATLCGLVLLAACAMYSGAAEADSRIPPEIFRQRTREENTRRLSLPAVLPQPIPQIGRVSLKIESTNGNDCVLLLSRIDAARLVDSVPEKKNGTTPDAANRQSNEPSSVPQSPSQLRPKKPQVLSPGYSN